MLESISNAVVSTIPAVSTGCYITAAFLGRKFCLAAGYKICGVIASLKGENNVAEWNKASQDYLTLAKKDVIRDLTALVGFLAMGFAASCAENKQEPKSENLNQKKTPYDWSSPLGAMGIVAGILTVDQMRVQYLIRRDGAAISLPTLLSYNLKVMTNRLQYNDIKDYSSNILNMFPRNEIENYLDNWNERV